MYYTHRHTFASFVCLQCSTTRSLLYTTQYITGLHSTSTRCFHAVSVALVSRMTASTFFRVGTTPWHSPRRLKHLNSCNSFALVYTSTNLLCIELVTTPIHRLGIWTNHPGQLNLAIPPWVGTMSRLLLLVIDMATDRESTVMRQAANDACSLHAGCLYPTGASALQPMRCLLT